MRFVIIGAGAVGGVVAGRLAGAGAAVALVARGAHLEAIRRDGLLLREAGGDSRHHLPAFATPAEVDWRAGDVAVLAVKSNSTESLLTRLPRDTPVVCLQNGVANERAALRLFPDVYGVCVMLPSAHLEPGVVVAQCAPIPGILDIGRIPGGVDPRAEAIAAHLVEAGFVCEARPDIMRRKYTKLLMNLGNAVEALCGRSEAADELAALLRAEGEAVLRAAGIEYASAAEDRERRGDLLQLVPVAGQERGGGSTWQSLARATGEVEADYLNGEIVLLGRLHDTPAPANETARRLVIEAATRGAAPGSMPPAQLRAAIDGSAGR
ncbi:ketopantoate reductase family protein [Dactylosporangium vinaceum]|uniref:Ketopantoate reductase family protein n=1 Tax=Dactylosporangium vinaceum TaxID=53362 RepID=A0ABV5MIV5_9ACTN|nr:2-dehydropantoate 2-reductase N-terminal domain-containing protein [Dactylosporangium vinaceum]